MPIKASERRHFAAVGDVRKEHGREVLDLDRDRLNMTPHPWSSQSLHSAYTDGFMLQNALGRMEHGMEYMPEAVSYLSEAGNTKEAYDEARRMEALLDRWREARLRYGPSRLPCPACGRAKCRLGGATLVVEALDGEDMPPSERTEYLRDAHIRYSLAVKKET